MIVRNYYKDIFFSGGNNLISRKVCGCLMLVLGVSTLDVGWAKENTVGVFTELCDY